MATFLDCASIPWNREAVRRHAVEVEAKALTIAFIVKHHGPKRAYGHMGVTTRLDEMEQMGLFNLAQGDARQDALDHSARNLIR